MKRIFQFVVTAAIAALVAGGISYSSHTAQSVSKETAYERVMRTRTLRCGYGIWEPLMMRDANTGKLSGAFVDYMEELGRNTGISIEWTAQVEWGTFPEDVQTGKIDAMCAGVWADGKRGTVVAWTTPIWYNVLDAYVRADDARFQAGQDNLDRLNAPDVTIAILDNTVPAQIALNYYQKAKTYSLPAMNSGADMMLSVITHKADAVFMDRSLAEGFQRNDTAHRLRLNSPVEHVAVYPVTVAVNIHETELQNFINAATYEILNIGGAARIAKKYDPDGTQFILPIAGYRNVAAAKKVQD